MPIKEYGKHVLMKSSGKIIVIQPKSYTHATSSEVKELLNLLFSGKYEIVHMAIPKENLSE